MVNILYLVVPLTAILFILFFWYYSARRKRIIEEGGDPGQSLPIVKIILTIAAIIIYAYIIMSYELVWWQLGIITAVAVIVIWLIWRKPDPEQEGQTPGAWTKITGYGKGRLPTIIGIVLLVVFLAIVGWGSSFFGSPDRIYHAEHLKNKCGTGCSLAGESLTVSSGETVSLGSDFDFSVIEIDFAEIMQRGDTINIYIGPYQAMTKIGSCRQFQERLCYLSWWYYTDTPSGIQPYGVSSGYVEVFYDSDSLKPLKIKKSAIDSGSIWIGDSSIIGLDRSSESLTPKPVEGEKKISCSYCKIKEVKVYYNFFARMQGLIG